MIRVVIDTNVVVSAYLNHDGLPFFILKLALAGVVRLHASAPILTEYDEVVRRKSIPLDRRRAVLFLQKVRSAAAVVEPAVRLKECADPDDDVFLECAQASRAHFLITGNTSHFPARWKSTRILTPRTFIEIWKDLFRGDPDVRRTRRRL